MWGSVAAAAAVHESHYSTYHDFEIVLIYESVYTKTEYSCVTLHLTLHYHDFYGESFKKSTTTRFSEPAKELQSKIILGGK